MPHDRAALYREFIVHADRALRWKLRGSLEQLVDADMLRDYRPHNPLSDYFIDPDDAEQVATFLRNRARAGWQDLELAVRRPDRAVNYYNRSLRWYAQLHLSMLDQHTRLIQWAATLTRDQLHMVLYPLLYETDQVPKLPDDFETDPRGLH